ncbi:hypothetical protein LPZ50_24610, partial [Bordetella petrii]|nr:hypothetical protein [Bordetella petrii]
MTATSPTALLAPAAPPVAADRAQSSARAGKTESFAQQLARQRGASTGDTQAVAPPATRPASGKPAASEAEPDSAAPDSVPESDAAAQAAAGAAAASAQAQPAQAVPTPSGLPAQALGIATQ